MPLNPSESSNYVKGYVMCIIHILFFLEVQVVHFHQAVLVNPKTIVRRKLKNTDSTVKK